MRGYLILYVVHIVGTRMIEPVINGISRENHMGGMMIGLNPLHFVTLYQGAEEYQMGCNHGLCRGGEGA